MDDFGAERIARIVAKYPRLFSSGRRPHRYNLPHGWAPIVDELVGSIDALLHDDRTARFFIFRIGEKAGRLRVDSFPDRSGGVAAHPRAHRYGSEPRSVSQQHARVRGRR